MKGKQLQQFELAGTAIKQNAEGLISLTDIFHAALKAGMADGKLEPKKWAQKPYSKKSGSTGNSSTSGGPGVEFIDFVAENLKVNAADVYKSTRGRGGGTFAHWQIALAYAKYLSPQLHMQVNEIYLRAKSGDITLADEIADKAPAEKQEELLLRLASKVTRNQFTSILGSHGVRNAGFAQCTNAIYIPLLGGKASEVKASRNLPAKSNLRANLDAEELIKTAHAEIIAKHNIVKVNARGNDECAYECERAAKRVASIQ